MIKLNSQPKLLKNKPQAANDERNQQVMSKPFSSRTVAYWLFASGQDDRLQRPVRLYSLRQNFWVFVLKKIGKYVTVRVYYERETRRTRHCTKSKRDK